MIACSDAGKLFDEYLDRELSADDIRRIEEHLHACELCFSHMEFDKAFRRFLENQADKIEFSEKTQKLIRRRLDETP